MNKQKLSLAAIQDKLSRNEMKQIMAGCGTARCGTGISCAGKKRNDNCGTNSSCMCEDVGGILYCRNQDI